MTWGGQPHCKDGCNCFKHKGIPYRTRHLCVVFEDDQRCRNLIHNKEHGWCRKHYTRFMRTGTTDYVGHQYRKTDRYKDKHKKKSWKARYKDSLRKVRCTCGCPGIEHTEIPSKCKRLAIDSKYKLGVCNTQDCKCRLFCEMTEDAYKSRIDKLINFGFYKHLNDSAICSYCNIRVTVGLLLDQSLLKRAAYHHYRTCPSLNKISLTVS